MANSFVKAERVVRTSLAILEREIMLPALVWRDAAGDFRGAKDDTISIRLPAYTTARTRVLRGGRPITMDELDETKVDVTLDTDVYKAVPITDEELTLDIESFADQVMAPVVASVARGVEDAVADEMTGATYENEVDMDPDSPADAVIDARRYLNDARVPQGDRVLVVGSGVEAAILKAEQFIRADASGDNTALRDANIGRIAGLRVVISTALPPDEAYAFHRTAYVLSMRAPIVPEGVTWGASASFAGLTMRTIRDYDFLNVQDRLLADVFIGTNHVSDRGIIDSDGKFQPSVDGADDPIFVRAVKINLLAS